MGPNLHKGLTLVQLNVRSLLANDNDNLDQVRDYLFDTKPDCFLITETWLKPKIKDNFLAAPNYQLARLDREVRKQNGRWPPYVYP